MSKFKMAMVGWLLAGSGGLVLAADAAATTAGRDAGAGLPRPAEVCAARSLHKVYTLADADFDLVRAGLNAELERSPRDPAGRMKRGEAYRIPDTASGFSVSLEFAECRQVAGPAKDAWRRFAGEISAKDCNEVGCEDPMPGWTAPEGSIMVISSCQNNVMREVTYVRENGTWKVDSVREDAVVSCDLKPDKGDGRDAGDKEP